MKLPKGHEDYNKKFWEVKKAIYGLKQSGAKWIDKLNDYLIKIGYKRLISEIECEDIRKVKVDETKYRSIIGNLLYLSIWTRSDIIFPLSKVARRAKDSNMEDWNNIMIILRYLKGTKKFGINFTNNANVKAYVDSDYGGDLETRHSTIRLLITFGGAPTLWCSKLQKSISTSTVEFEYYSLSECGKQCIWYLNLFEELNLNIKNIEVNVDNKVAICIAKIKLSIQN